MAATNPIIAINPPPTETANPPSKPSRPMLAGMKIIITPTTNIPVQTRAVRRGGLFFIFINSIPDTVGK
jgi:hypothetical protein